MSARAGTEKVSHTGKTSLEEGAQARLLRRTRKYFLDYTIAMLCFLFTGWNKAGSVKNHKK